MKRRIFSIFCSAVLLILCVSGCTFDKSGSVQKENKGISVVCTNFPGYDFVRAVAGEKASVTMLLKPGTESHTYEPNPSDILKIKNSSLFVCVGGESESWLDSVIDSAGLKEESVMKMMDCVKLIEEDEEGGEDDASGIEYDEHVWTSPENAIAIISKIEKKLAEIDKNNEEIYKTNAQKYISDIEKIDKSFSEIADNAKNKTLIFGDKFPFKYFAQCYGINCYAAFPGCSEQTEPSAQKVAFLIDKVKGGNIPVVLYIEFSNHKVADAICEATGAKACLFHSCHNISAEEFESGKTYVDFMTENVKVFREAMN